MPVEWDNETLILRQNGRELRFSKNDCEAVKKTPN